MPKYATREMLINAATEGLNKSLNQIRQNMRKEAPLGFRQWLQKTMAIFEGTRLAGPPGVRKRTGHLSRSFYTTVSGDDLGTLVAKIASRAKYARVLEYGTKILPGGVIKSKRPGGALAIPIEDGPAATAAKVYRGGAGSLRQILPQVAPHVKFFVHVTEGDKAQAVLMGQEGDQDPVPWFVLMKSVKFDPKLGLVSTIKKNLKHLRDGLGKKIQASINRG